MRRRFLNNINNRGGGNIILPPGELIRRDINYNQYYAHNGFVYEGPSSIIIKFGEFNDDFNRRFVGGVYGEDEILYELGLSSIYPNEDGYPRFQWIRFFTCNQGQCDDDMGICEGEYSIGLGDCRVNFDSNNLHERDDSYIIFNLQTYTTTIYSKEGSVLAQYTPSNLNPTYRDEHPILPLVCPRYVYWFEDEAPYGCENVLPYPDISIEYVSD